MGMEKLRINWLSLKPDNMDSWESNLSDRGSALQSHIDFLDRMILPKQGFIWMIDFA